jgi:uncharacterized RDD family membrane protein YckC
VNAIAPSSAPVTGPSLDNRRILAGLVDIVIVAAGTALLGVLVAVAGGSKWGPPMALVSLAWALYYYFALESGNGQTLGKKLMKLRVMRADGARTGMQEIAVRTALRIVDGMFLYLVGLVVMLVTGQRRQRLGDIAAGTVVMDASGAQAPVAAGPTDVSASVADVPATEAPAYPADIGSPLPAMAAPELPAAPTYNPSSADAAYPPQAPGHRSLEPALEPPEQDPPAHEPEVVVVSSHDDDDDDDGDQMTVKSVETVSAMDLIMDDGDDEDTPPPVQGDGPAGP